MPDPTTRHATAEFCNLPLAELQRQLGADGTGLADDQVRRRLARFGPNRLYQTRERPAVLQWLARFGNPLVLLLLAAGLASALTGDAMGSAIITAIAVLSVSFDFVQEYRAGRAVEALRASVALSARVRRNGEVREVPVADLVPGDTVLLSAGDLISADGRILEARDFFVGQAALTGEPYPVEKRAGELAATARDATDAWNGVFAGGSVLSGMATMLVCRTGHATAFGQIARSVAARRPPTAFEGGVHAFAMLIVRLTILLVVSVLVINWAFHRPFLQSVLFSIALAVGLTPELLPMIVTVTLASGAMRLARRRVIVKQLEAMHNLGSMDVLCTDKTGTLTEAKIALATHVDCSGSDSARVLQLAYLNSFFETGLKSPLDDAILAHEAVSTDAWRKIDEVPFDFERRRVSVLLDNGTRRLLAVKGAPEDILKHAALCEQGGAVVPLDEERRGALQRVQDALGVDGLRVLGVAWRDMPAAHDHARLDDETQLVFAGFAAFLDPPRSDAARSLEALARSRVTVKIVTGDSEAVTLHVCRQVNLPVTGVLNGAEIDALDERALAARAEVATAFCRVTPPQKERIVRALKSRGHTVGFLGDGINDAPALHAADVGITVESAAEVARAAAQMILLERGLGVLNEGILEGRRTFSNVMKYILMGTSSNFGNMFSMAGATLVLPFLPMLPLQVLLNNLLYDISEIAIPLDAVDADDLRSPRRWDMKQIRSFMYAAGAVSSLFDFLTFYLMLGVFHVGEAAFHTGWFVESIATQVLVIFVIRTRGNPLRSRCSPWLVASTLGVVATALMLPWLPVAPMLGFELLPGRLFVALAATVVCYLLVMQLIKRRYLARPGAAHPAWTPA